MAGPLRLNTQQQVAFVLTSPSIRMSRQVLRIIQPPTDGYVVLYSRENSRRNIKLNTYLRLTPKLESVLKGVIQTLPCVSLILKAVERITCFIVTLTGPSGAPSTVWLCGRSFAGLAGSNSAGGMDVCVFCVFCVCRKVEVTRTGRSLF
jgi:hypothetical protein